METWLILSLMRGLLPVETRKHRKRCARVLQRALEAAPAHFPANDGVTPARVVRTYCQSCGRCAGV